MYLLRLNLCSCVEIKRPGRGVYHSPPSSAEVEETVELYLSSLSGASWPIVFLNFIISIRHILCTVNYIVKVGLNILLLLLLLFAWTVSRHKHRLLIFKCVAEFIYLGTTLTHQNGIYEEIRSRLKSGNAYCLHCTSLVTHHFRLP
jgi:hypothetical protein